MKKRRFLFILLIFTLILATACHKKAEPQPVNTQKKQAVQESKPSNKTIENTTITEDVIENKKKKDDFESKSIDELNNENILEDVYFEFDKATLTPETRRVLKKHAEWLKKHPTVKILVEGHCDERGTEQYNLALGDRRAHAVKNYLISLGISPDRIKTISYGEMFPKVKGHNEWAWSQNRRCHFVIIAK